MARVNFEDRWWIDPRRSALIRAVGSEEFADGLVAKVWRVAQEHWSTGDLIPFRMFRLMPHWQSLIEVGLARLHVANHPSSPVLDAIVLELASNARRTDAEQAFVYCSGALEFLSWVAEKRRQASDAGKKSADARRRKAGSAQPGARTNAERTSNDTRTESNDAEPSGSGSGSDSGSFSEEEENEFDAEELEGAVSDFQIIPEFDLVDSAFLRQVPTEVQQNWVATFTDTGWIRDELRDATLWLKENPQRRKKNLARFFGGWLRRASKQRQQPAGSTRAGGPRGKGPSATIDRLANQWERVEKGEL